jgi:transposase
MDISYKESYAMNPKETRRKVVESYIATGSISQTARLWHTSRNVVRKWVRRYNQEGIAGLEDRSHRPHHSPTRTPSELEEKVIAARQATGYGRKRLAWYLWREEGVAISPRTIRHILRRHGMTGKKKKRRKTFYPAHWSWEEERPFAFGPGGCEGHPGQGHIGDEAVGSPA